MKNITDYFSEYYDKDISTEQALRIAEQARKELHRLIDEQVDDYIRRVVHGEEIIGIQTVSLGTNAKELKGTKPKKVFFPGKDPVAVKTWQQVASAILNDCNSDPNCHNALLYLRDKVHGRSRTLVSSFPDGMRKPHRIDDNLYVECDFDTEALMYALTEKILPHTGYEWRGILIELQEPKLALGPDVECEEPIANYDMEMKM